MTTPLIIAHRTAPLDAAENSLQGIATARRLGADGVEIDLRMTIDQQPFLLHDYSLHRTTGFPLPLELTPSAIVRKLRLHGTRETVPSLSDALDALGSDMSMAVDVKTPWAVVPLVREVKRRGLESRVLVWCQSAMACRYVSQRLPTVEVAHLKTTRTPASRARFLQTARASGARAISAHWLAIDREFVQSAHAMGLRVFSWHETYPLDFDRLSSGLVIHITDWPEFAREACDAVESGQAPSPTPAL